MRFAVHWPQQPGASPRSHGMPCRDVPGRIHISIAREPAGSAREDRLALAVLCRHVPARATALRRVCGANLLYSSWSLVLQSTHQHSPAASEHAPVQSGLLAYSPTRLARRASRGTGHAGDAQVLDADHIETASQVSRGLLDPVLAPIGLADLEPGDGQLHSGASGRPSAGTGQLALQFSSRACSVWRRVGQCSNLPVDRAALTATPRSIPTISPVPGAASGSGMVANPICQRRARSHFTR